MTQGHIVLVPTTAETTTQTTAETTAATATQWLWAMSGGLWVGIFGWLRLSYQKFPHQKGGNYGQFFNFTFWPSGGEGVVIHRAFSKAL